MADIGTLSPEQMLQQQQNLRNLKMSEMLMQQGMQQPQGQMVSGRYVAPSIFQNLGNLANLYMGQRGIERAEQAQLDMAKAIRNQEGVALADYMGQLQGKPAVPEKVTELAGPYTGNIPKPVATIEGTPAVAGNPMLANMNALQNPNSPAFLRQLAIKKITEGPKWKEIQEFNQKTGNTENYRYDENSTDPRSTLQFLGISKPAISPSDRLTFQDKGIAIPTNYGGGSPMVNAPMGGGNMPVAGNVPVVAGNAPVVGNQPTNKPATTASTNDLVKTYGYDPFKLPAMPPQPSGEAAREWQKNAYKPLEGTAGQKVDGAKMYYNSLEKYNNYVSTLTAADLVNPSVRSRLNSLYATAKLTGKEANNLGVLNGGDERILEEVLPNYKDITVTKKNLDRIVQDQKEFASGIIVEAYGTQQKVVPQNMRKFVVVPSTQEVKADTPVKNAPVQRAILNNEPIETRNGKWVYSKTGKAVE
jgi:hypothetical protein